MPAFVRRVVQVGDHPSPEKPHLGVYTLSSPEGKLCPVCIGVDPAEGVRRFAVGDLLVHVEPGSTIPDWIEGFDNLKNRKVKASNFAGVRSEGIMLNVEKPFMPDKECYIHNQGSDVGQEFVEGDDVSRHLGIT